MFSSKDYDDTFNQDDVTDSNDDSTDLNDNSGDDDDNVGQASVEINVESLIAEIEQDKAKSSDNYGDLRNRLDEMLEKKKHKHDLDGFDEYDID
jgi:hypothetical protein